MLPPLSGFVAKFGMFHALLNPGPVAPAIGAAGWTLMALVFTSGFAAIVSLMRFGVRTFWTTQAVAPPSLHGAEVMPVAALLLVSVVLTVQAQPVSGYLARASADIHRPALYIDRVLATPPVPGPAAVEAP